MRCSAGSVPGRRPRRVEPLLNGIGKVPSSMRSVVPRELPSSDLLVGERQRQERVPPRRHRARRGQPVRGPGGRSRTATAQGKQLVTGCGAGIGGNKTNSEQRH